MDAHSESARAGVDVITRECALTPSIQLTPCIERQQMCRDYRPVLEGARYLAGPVCPPQSHGANSDFLNSICALVRFPWRAQLPELRKPKTTLTTCFRCLRRAAAALKFRSKIVDRV